ncbi:PulJ/GspJ family protein [Parvibium lacunae]|uniref:Prepilin-type N-terminal cleavage/methylation domain-containing protein n=1 Tax=Parvibium lacunae TaxID=1888893 RepID=A0A368L098_9BURK|nr:prepilin-type N-terminal cleavage/methylation domain-containing protein [Parvibium lacunae]RCS56814.1 prepilin-type N-terminal cleavage/methylation domain-containing protein [Parvibium lacunae]
MRRQTGFTLLELLVALAILAILAVLSFRGLSSVLQARDALQRQQSQLREQTRFMQILQQDLENLVTPDKHGLAFTPLWIDRLNQQGRLILLREVSRPEEGLRLERVEYYWQQQQVIRYRLPWSFSQLGRILDAATPTQTAPPETLAQARSVLLNDIQKFEFGLFMANTGWIEAYQGDASEVLRQQQAALTAGAGTRAGITGNAAGLAGGALAQNLANPSPLYAIAVRFWPSTNNSPIAAGAPLGQPATLPATAPVQRLFSLGRP